MTRTKAMSNFTNTKVRTLRSNTKRQNGMDHHQNTGNNARISTHNRFSTLQHYDTEMDDWNDVNHPTNSTNTAPKNKIFRPPPIKITDERLNIVNIKEYITELGITSFQTKGTSIGIKIDLEKKEDHVTLADKLKADKFAFFTHSASDQKLFKVVLSGLPTIDPSIISNELKRFNINASSVSELSTKNPNPNHCLYLVQLPKNDVTLGQLRKIRAIDHVIVEWKPFQPRNKGPTQCKRCAMLGHGAQNCHRKEACLICASTNHVADNCPFKEETSKAFVFKCFNCASKNLTNTKHKASDPNCPSRAEYLEIRNKINHRNTIRSNRQKQNFNAFNLKENNFPNLSKNADFAASNQSIGPSYADRVKTSPVNTELYSMEELSEILYTTVDELMACTSKGQQLKVLFKLLSDAFK